MSHWTDLKEKYEGAVISNFERNGYHDSDFYAIVYDAEVDRVRAVETGTTRFAASTAPLPVDITDTNLVKARMAAEKQAYEALLWLAKKDARVIQPGKVVRFTRNFNGRTQPKAQEGELLNVATVWEESWNGSYPTTKVKGWTADGRELTVPSNAVEVADPESYYDRGELEVKAAGWAEQAAKTKNFRGILEGWLS